MNNIKDIVNNIREKDIDINNQESFFSILIKGLLLRLDDDITVRGKAIPHIILHTGDDTMYLNFKGQDQSKEPLEVSNEDYIYNTIPRCIVNPGGVDIVPDQLTSPYSLGSLQYESNDGVYGLVGEFRRMPVKLSCDLKYYVDSYTDMLALTQQIITKLSFIRTYKISYLGQTIVCSYKIPEAFSGEHVMELDGTTQDNKNKTIQLSIEVESNLPIYSAETIMPADKRITATINNITYNGTKIN